MSQASTEMRQYQERFGKALELDYFTAEEVKAMLLDAVRFMNQSELDRLLEQTSLDKYDL